MDFRKLFTLGFAWIAVLSITFAETMDIGVREAPPFSFENRGAWDGLSVNLWSSIAEDAGYQTRFIEYGSLQELFTALEKGEIDLIASSVSVTSEREAIYDFSHPFLSSNLAILARADSTNKWWIVIKSFISWPFFLALGSLGLVLLGAGAA